MKTREARRVAVGAAPSIHRRRNHVREIEVVDDADTPASVMVTIPIGHMLATELRFALTPREARELARALANRAIAAGLSGDEI